MKRSLLAILMLCVTILAVRAQNSFQSSVKPLPQVGKENAATLGLNPKVSNAYIQIYKDTDARLKAIKLEKIDPAKKKQKMQQALSEGESAIQALLNEEQYAAHQQLTKENVKEAKTAAKQDIDRFINEELQLTEEQKMQVTIVLADQAKKEKTLTGTPQQIKVQKNLLALDSLKKLDKILNQQQKDKLLAYLTQ